MHIIHIASELAPIAKVGGLADVVMGLSRELSWKGHDVDIIIPNYDCKDSKDIRDMNICYTNLLSYYAGQWFENTVWMGWVENLKVYFIEPHHPRYFFNRGCYYGCEDDTERYLYFSRAAIEFLYKKQISPDIIHLHDWQTAAIAPLFTDIYAPLGFDKPKLVFSIHNLEYQGKCAVSDLDNIGLNGKELHAPEKMEDPTNKAIVNLLKGAIVYSDYVTTVSPTYAEEAKKHEGGKGLEAILNAHSDKFCGILNGIDYSYWNPEIDRYLPAHFSSREQPSHKKDYKTLDKKGFIKRTLRERLALEECYRPIIGCIARLVPQKGIDLIEHAIHFCAESGLAQFVLLGSSPIPEIQEKFHKLKHHYAQHAHVQMVLHHQEELAHLIYGGSDLLIVPSIFEPCGLTQMIALKYGTIPVVRKTGGLADTIFDVDSPQQEFQASNGYTFTSTDPKELEATLRRAIDNWISHPEKWRQLMIKGMNIDFSWNMPSNAYLKIYTDLCKGK